MMLLTRNRRQSRLKQIDVADEAPEEESVGTTVDATDEEEAAVEEESEESFEKQMNDVADGHPSLPLLSHRRMSSKRQSGEIRQKKQHMKTHPRRICLC
jgi:hypothetical protein